MKSEDASRKVLRSDQPSRRRHSGGDVASDAHTSATASGLNGQPPAALSYEAICKENRDLRLRLSEAESLVAADLREHKRQERLVESEVFEELRLAKEAAEAANDAKSRFLSNISHELRTPMNSILGMTELALNEDITSGIREYLTTVKESADMLLELLNDILDFSRMESGRLQLESVPFSLRLLLEQTLKTLGVRAYEKHLELICDLPQSIPDRVIGDPLRLREIILNLVGNAIKFTSQGEIVVRAAVRSQTPEEAVLDFAVEDTGIGVAPEDQRRIFAPFVQADASTTRNYGGSGLGLAIVANLVSLMRGEAWVESQLGCGSTFRFTATLALPGDDQSAPETAINELEGLQGLPVLIVSANVTQRRMLERTLSHWGMKTESTGDVPAALTKIHDAAAAGDPFPVAIVDAAIPQIDGFTLVAWIKNDPRLVGSVIVLGSVTEKQMQISRCQELGALYLEKPVLQASLLSAVTKALGRSCPLPRSAVATPADAPGPMAVRSLRILLAEDNLANQKVAVYILQKHGHTVTVAGDGCEAVERLCVEDFDLVLMDVQMPKMDGLQATAAIRAMPEATKARLPIIAMTAHAMKGDQERCLAAGMDAYVAKPINRRELLEAIRRAVGGAAEADVDEAAPVKGAVWRRQATVPTEIFDIDAAVSHCLGQRELFAEMVEYFFQEADASLEKMRMSLGSSDAPELSYLAHRFVGTISHLGASAALLAARRLEHIGRTGDLEGADDALGQLSQHIAVLKQVLSEYR